MIALRSVEPSTLIGWRPDVVTVRRAVEIVLLLLLAAQGARLVWMAITPAGPLGEPVAAYTGAPAAPPVDMSVLERFAPTPSLPLAIAGTPSTVVSAPPPIAGFRLQGVRGSIAGDGGSAIIAGPDGKQASYQRGDTVAPGVTLAAIGRDGITLSGAGGSVRLTLDTDAPPPALPPSAPALGFNLASPPVATTPTPAPGAPPGAAPAPTPPAPNLGDRR